MIRWSKSRGAALGRCDYTASVIEAGLVLATLEVCRRDREWVARVVDSEGHAYPWSPTHARLERAKHDAAQRLAAAIRNIRAGVCPHGGTFTGPCMPRVLDGRCIWCERALPAATSRSAEVYPVALRAGAHR